MTEPKHAGPPDRLFSRQRRDLDAFRADLEQQRQFRIEQLKELMVDMLAEPDGALDEVISALMTAATDVLAERANHVRAVSSVPTRQSPSRPTRREPPPLDIVDIWGYDSFPASDPPANW